MLNVLYYEFDKVMKFGSQFNPRSSQSLSRTIYIHVTSCITTHSILFYS
jgi:hypothetical protein